MKFAVVNLGCKVNRVESDSYEKILSRQGYAAVEEDADIVVVNTCTVTGVAEKKTRKAVRYALKKHPRACVIVTGCAAAINPDVFHEMSDRVVVASKAESFLKVEELAAAAHGDSGDSGDSFDHDLTSRTRVGVKVQDGCDNACTYCIVHVARGKAVSRPIDDVLAEVKELANQGIREIVLSGINIGSYSWQDYSLTELLECLLAATEPEDPREIAVRFRVSSIEPMDVSDSFIKLLASSNGRICRHLHLPLQSGNTKVLREMARPYDAEDFRSLVDYIRAEVPEISLSTDIICGFPGESRDEFEDTLEMARYCGFSKIHVFPYSLREGTPAAERADQVPPHVRSERAAELRKLGDELRLADYAERAGGFEYVLVEQEARAMTESYYEVEVPAHLRRGELVKLVLPPQACSDSLLVE